MTAHQPVAPVQAETHRPARLRYGLIGIGLVGISFLLFLARPYSVMSDIGYQALSARQYVDHYTAFDSIRLVNPRDLARDVVTPLTAWTPSWTALYVLAFKAGLSPGEAGRILALLVSLCGALGWVQMIARIGLKGRWRIAGIVFASLYCLRSSAVTMTGAGDQIVYAVAPWLLAAAMNVAVPWNERAPRRLAFKTTLLCLALGGVYWLKYSGIFLSLAILAAVLIEQLYCRFRKRAVSSFLLLALYGVAFLVPLDGLRAYNYTRTGSDFIESAARVSPPRNALRLVQFFSETAFNVSPTLFSAGAGMERIAGVRESARGWLLRTPGLVLLVAFFYVMLRQPSTYLRNVTVLSGLIPLLGFPVLSFVGGPHFAFAIARCCLPYWILLELMILSQLAQTSGPKGRFDRNARYLLAACAAFQVLLFLWIPFESGKEALKIARTPKYQSSAAKLWDTDLSKYGTRDIDERVRALIRTPRDVIVPALYSDRAFATDTMLEFGGRLLPLSPGFVPLVATHGKDGANYYSATPFVSSVPLRIILVAPDPYERADFRESTQRIMRRFTQVREWIPGPPDPYGRAFIWTGEVNSTP